MLSVGLIAKGNQTTAPYVFQKYIVNCQYEL